MLGKLIKHEFKAVWKFLTIMAVFMVVMTLVGVIGSNAIAPIFDNDISRNGTHGNIVNILLALYMMTYILTAFLLTAGTYIYLAVRFYQSMYGNQGYLTNTLPTTPLCLLTAKLLTAVSWVIISIVLLVSSVIALVFSAASAAGVSTEENIWEALMQSFRSVGVSPFLAITLLIILIIVAIFYSILMMYGATALGQLMKKHRILATIGFYFALSMLTNIIMTTSFAVRSFNTLYIVSGPDGPIEYSYGSNGLDYAFNNNIFNMLISIAITFAAAAGLFFLTHYVTSKRLNLE
jgi:hypothetical protein